MTNPTTPSCSPATPTAPAPFVPPTKSGLSEAELKSEIAWTKERVANGTLAPEQADKIFFKLNMPVDQRAERSEEAKQLDRTFGPRVKDSEICISWTRPGQAPLAVDPKEMQARDANVRGWLVDTGASREHASSTINIIAKSIEHESRLTPAQREAYKEQENEKLRTLFGGQEKLDAALQPAKQMVLELNQKRPGLVEIIQAHGDHAVFVNQLTQLARIYHARKQG